MEGEGVDVYVDEGEVPAEAETVGDAVGEGEEVAVTPIVLEEEGIVLEEEGVMEGEGEGDEVAVAVLEPEGGVVEGVGLGDA